MAVDYGEVVGHAPRQVRPWASGRDAADLVAYLKAVGDGVQAYERDGATSQLREIADFASVLATAILAHDNEIISLAVDTVGGELRDLTERIPDLEEMPPCQAVTEERNLARMALQEVVLILRSIDIDSADGKYSDAAREYETTIAS